MIPVPKGINGVELGLEETKAIAFSDQTRSCYRIQKKMLYLYSVLSTAEHDIRTGDRNANSQRANSMIITL
jgi:hypothetical protein